METLAQSAEIFQQTSRSQVSARYVGYGLLTIVLLTTCIIRLHLRDIPLERDEGEYAYAGQLMLQGVPPYKLAYNMKLPGTYVAYAAIMAVFGQTIAGIRLGVLIVNLLTIFLIFLLAKRFGGFVAGVAAAASYALLSISPTVLGFCGHATHFVVLPAIAGVLLLLEGLEQNRSGMLFLSGLLFGLAFLMKQPGIMFAIFGFLYLLAVLARRGVKKSRLAATAGLFSLGAAVPFLLTCLVLWRAGVFGKFWFWTVSYASQYASNYGLIAGGYFFKQTFGAILWSSLGIWLIAILGAAVVGWDGRLRSNAGFVLGFTAFSFLAVCPGLFFRPHYFILLLPATSLLVGIAVASTTSMVGRSKRNRMWQYVPSALLTLALAASFYSQRDFFLETDPVAACRAIYAGNPFPEAIPISDYIREHTPANATIAVLGSEPEIYFYSHRHSATGYIYTYGLMEEQKYALQMQQQMISEIEASRPEMLVFVNLSTSWLPDLHSEQLIYTWARKYIQDYYEPMGVVDVPIMQNDRLAGTAGSPDARPYSAIFLFKRKSS